MKKIILLFFLLTAGENIFAQLSLVNNYPFKIGNTFTFRYSSSGCCPPGSNTSYYKGKILRDTLINSKKYFFITNYFNNVNKWWRIDSTSGILFVYDTTSICERNFHETKVDSLFASVGDSLGGCGRSGYVCRNIGSTTIFNTTKPSKTFDYSFSVGSSGSYGSRLYCNDFGLIKISSSGGRPPSTYNSSFSLIGCIINGVLYGDTNTVGVVNYLSEVPDLFSLHQNYPNPFNPSTKINYEIKTSAFVSMKVFDLQGKEIASLVNEKQNAGSYAVDFNSSEYNLPSGIYFYTLNAGEFKETRKMILVK